MKRKPIDIVDIIGFEPLYREGEEANAIQLINFNFSDGTRCGFNVVAQRGLYNIGSKAIYIQPDYMLSDEITLFDSFTKPNGIKANSRLGKNNRIRSIKFRFSKNKETEENTYSTGILIPYEEVCEFLSVEDLEGIDLMDKLKVSKINEAELLGNLPSYIYSSDEENILNSINEIEKAIERKLTFGLTTKRDGGSISVAVKKNDYSDFEASVCSRLTTRTKYTDIIDYLIYNGIKYRIKNNKGDNEKVLISEEKQVIPYDDNVKSNSEVFYKEDLYYKVAHESGLVERAIEYCEKHDIELNFRGELLGKGSIGSDSKINYDRMSDTHIVLYGIDDLSSGFAKRCNYSDIHNLKKVSDEIGYTMTEVTTITVSSYDELISICDSYIKNEENDGRVIEGIIVRSNEDNSISLKYMNDEYDSKK